MNLFAHKVGAALAANCFPCSTIAAKAAPTDFAASSGELNPMRLNVKTQRRQELVKIIPTPHGKILWVSLRLCVEGLKLKNDA